jgi:hypothetical protein
VSRSFATAVAVLTLALSAVAQTPAALACKAPIFDFGTKPQGVRFEGSFEIENPGDAVVSVSSVEIHCSCATASVEPMHVPAKGKAIVRFTFETRSFEGAIAKAVQVNTVGGPKSGLMLTVKGEIRARWSVEPASIDLGEVKPGDVVERTVRVRVDANSGVAVKAVEPLAAMPFRLRALEPDALGDARWLVRFTVPKDVKPGTIQYAFSFDASGDDLKPVAIVPIVGRIHGDLVVTPRAVAFGLVAAGNEARKTVVFESETGRPFRILATQSDDTIVVEGRTDEAKTKHELTVVCAKSAPARPLRSQILVTTDHPDEARVVLTVFAQVEKP